MVAPKWPSQSKFDPVTHFLSHLCDPEEARGSPITSRARASVSASLCRLSICSVSHSLSLNNSVFLAHTFGCCQPLLLICTRCIQITPLPFSSPHYDLSSSLPAASLTPICFLSPHLSALSFSTLLISSSALSLPADFFLVSLSHA